MNIKSRLLDRILQMFHYLDHEIGGLLLIKSGEIIDFIIDREGQSDRKSYHPSAWLANRIEESVDGGYEIALVHCHPETGLTDPCLLSGGDEYFAQSFMKLNQWNVIDMAIVSGNSLNIYRCVPGNIICLIDLIVSD